MKIVTDNDVQTFIDPDGDSLTLLASVRQRDVEKAAELQSKESVEGLKTLGISMEEALKQAQQTSAEEQAAARERMKEAGHSPALRRLRLEAIARELVVGGQTYGGHAIVEAYENMAAPSARWVDEQVDSVWDRAQPDDASRESAPAGVDGPDQPERSA